MLNLITIIKLRLSIWSNKVSQKVVNSLEQGGGATAVGSSIAGYISANHELFWFTFAFIGCIVGITGMIINILKFRREKEVHELTMEMIRKGEE